MGDYTSFCIFHQSITPKTARKCNPKNRPPILEAKSSKLKLENKKGLFNTKPDVTNR
jgi:hypothetical protein